MACNAVGSFPREIPYECAVALVAAIKNKAPNGEILQIASQCSGQIGALMSPAMLGSSTEDIVDPEILARVERGIDEVKTTSADRGTLVQDAPGGPGSILTESLKTLIVQLLLKLLT